MYYNEHQLFYKDLLLLLLLFTHFAKRNNDCNTHVCMPYKLTTSGTLCFLNEN